MILEGCTFDDVLFVPQRSPIGSRKEIDTTGRFSRKISLKVPIISANMDTVTESAMAISMARCGGLGVVHRFLPIDKEAEEVTRVKRAESILIEKPYTLRPEQTIDEARKAMKRYQVGGLLVVDQKSRLAGILTPRDVMFHTDGRRLIKDAMTRNVISAKVGVSIEKAERILAENKIEKLPLVDNKGMLKGLITAKDILRKRQYPEASKDAKGRLMVGAAIGVAGDSLERASALLGAGADVLVVDVAHGHADHVIKAIERIKKKHPRAQVVAGNVATYQACRALASAGADGIKVGVGPGGACTTRSVTGAGVPQLSAIMDCSRITREKGIPVIADGGIRDSGDIAKALAAGASSVMLGQLLAGTTESPGWTAVKGGIKYKVYRGMASLHATISRWQKEQADEDIEEEDVSSLVPEGIETMVPFQGDVSEVLNQLRGGLRSGMSYSGARNLKEFWKKTRFLRITPAAKSESKRRAAE